jgi:predicted  nucleic acid-binding Zn-ribbon protein
MDREKLIEGLKLLCQIQEIDLELKDLENQLNDIPLKISQWKDELEGYKKEIEKNKKETEKFTVELKEKELEVESNHETLKKYNAQLYTVRTNKEYSSLLHEIEEVKRKNSHIEDDILELMESVDSNEKGLKEKRKKLEELQKEFNKKEKEEKEKEKNLSEKLTRKRNKRENIAADIEGPLLTKYTRISKAKGGIAIVPLLDKCCGGCNLELPPQILSEVKFGSKTITCEGCGRILYWKESLNIKTS